MGVTLRVGLVHYTAPPIVGGVESVLGHQARLLAAGGHQVRVIAGRGGAGGAGIEVVRVPLADAREPRIRGLREALDAGRVPADFAPVVAALSESLATAAAGLDVLIVHNALSLHLNLALTAALRELLDAGRLPPVVAWHHDLAHGSPRFAGSLHPGHPWDLLKGPWAGVTHVAISDARRQEVIATLGLTADAVRVIPNGIDVEAFLGLHPASRRLLASLRLPLVGPVLLAPARMTPRKNLELAIAAVASLRTDGSDARLIVTGPSDPHEAHGKASYADGLAALARQLGVDGAIHLLAHGGRSTPARVVADLYLASDALLVTSRDEGFGLPVLEAAVSRLPIICADLPPLRALAGAAAAYFQPDAAPAEVAEVIRKRLAADEETQLRIRVRSTLSWASVYAARLEPLLREVAGQARPPAG